MKKLLFVFFVNMTLVANAQTPKYQSNTTQDTSCSSEYIDKKTKIRYEGFCSDGVLTIYKVTWPNGERYEGGWSNNNQNGRGIFYSIDGSIKNRGIWKDGLLVTEYLQQNASAKDIYKNSCAACHEIGVAGAPKMGIKTDWEPRIKKSVETLIQSVRLGIRAMPGYSKEYNDREIERVVIYMINASGVATPVIKPPTPTSSPQDIKRQKCIRLGLAPGSADFQQCIN
jgi:hypothetical protein